MHCHCGNNRAPRWTFTDPCKPEVRPGAREESAYPAWLAAPAMNARNITKVYIWRLDTGVDRHYIGSVTATTHQEKGIITPLESNPSRGTVLPAPHGKGNKSDKNVKYKRTDALSLCVTVTEQFVFLVVGSQRGFEGLNWLAGHNPRRQAIPFLDGSRKEVILPVVLLCCRYLVAFVMHMSCSPIGWY